MPWVRFTDDFDFQPSPRAVIVHKKGAEYLVTQACAEQAIAAGKAEYVERAQSRPTRSPPITTGAAPRRPSDASR